MATTMAAPFPRPPHSTSSNRAALAGGLEFLEPGSPPGWSGGDLYAWFDEHLVEQGHMVMPRVAMEPGAGSVLLDLHRPPPRSSLARILTAARSNVVSALRGLIASPADDRFLTAAIFSGRVCRRRVGRENEWVAQPDPNGSLSGIVLSLFAADALSHRDIYDKLLSVCDSCNRVTFQEEATARYACPMHWAHGSGFVRSAAARQTSTG
jgi:predicted RNA-binding Zn-ribbon protein involved in translation (DUF1610 family)